MPARKRKSNVKPKSDLELESDLVVQRLTGTPIPVQEDTDPWQENGLTVREEAFVAALVGPAAGNATTAACLAGYAPENRKLQAEAASRILSRPHVAKAISHALTKKYGTGETAVNELTAIATGDFNQFCTVQPDGQIRVDWKKAAESGALGLVKEMVLNEDTGAPKSFKLNDRVRALEILLRLHGLLTEKHEHTGPNGGPLRLIVDTGLVKQRIEASAPGLPEGGSNEPT